MPRSSSTRQRTPAPAFGQLSEVATQTTGGPTVLAPASPPARDHLFISYAWEDGALAEWLARKLTAAGYRVWIDRFKMLGGERWPKDIDRAIKERTFRMIALLSRHSLVKPNPCKERQLALALSRDRQEDDFLIPLNVDGLRPTEIGWELSDLNYIGFERWSDGYAQLAKKLEALNAPRPLGGAGPAAAAATYLPADVLCDETEVVYTNCLVVRGLPEVIHRFTLGRPLATVERDALQLQWAFERVDDTHVLAFTDPPADAVPACPITRGSGACWRDVHRIDGVRSTHVVSSLVKKSLTVRCIARGLARTDDGRTLYFPAGALEKDRISYRNYKGTKTWIAVLGERRFGTKRSRYHLAVAFWVRSDVLDGLVVEMKVRLHLTDPSGEPLDGKAVNTRRKKIAKSWWNHDWLSRQLALASHLAGDGRGEDGTAEIVIGAVAAEQVRLAGQLLTATVRPRINDAKLEPLRAKVAAMHATLEAAEPDREADDTTATDSAPAPSGQAAVTILREPDLEFRYGQRAADPHAGLALFGPYDADAPNRPARLPYGVLGAPEGVEAFRAFAARIEQPVVSQVYGDPATERKDHLLWPPWPGFEAAFHAVLPPKPAWARALDRDRLLKAARHNDKYRRAYDVVNLYLDAIGIARERDDPFALFVCVVPDEVYENCRPLSKVSEGEGVALSKKERELKRNQADLFSPYAPEEYDLSVDFRRQLKARVMAFGVPVQIIRESTLVLREPEPSDARSLTKLSDRAWNLATALYYKAGGKPWRLSTARDGVCYVGLAFRRSEVDTDPKTACCAAQMFLDTGDGVVFRGEFGPWYSPDDTEHHLSTEAAEALLRGVLDAYDRQEGRPLKEIFLHSRSTISAAEFAGYKKACPPEVTLVGVRVRRESDGLRLYRPGKWPVLRGTCWVTGPRTAYLWATGFKPTVLSYDGWEVPVPLRIDVEHGQADIAQVARDILGLTKLNYNTCKLGDGAPVTVGFSDAVGEILVGNPYIKHRLPAFKFYI